MSSICRVSEAMGALGIVCPFRPKYGIAVAKGDKYLLFEHLSGYEKTAIVRARVGRFWQELSFLESEIDVIGPWMASVAQARRPFASNLPVPEFWREPWNRGNYRWTAAAHDVALAHERARRAGGR